MRDWSPVATSRYQDHVIAHVLGATALGHFVIDDAAYVLLDIALIWTIYTSGEMDLMPQAVVISDLEAEDEVKRELLADLEKLHRGETGQLARMAPTECLISDVKVYAQGECRRVVLECEDESLIVEGTPESGRMRLFSN